MSFLKNRLGITTALGVGLRCVKIPFFILSLVWLSLPADALAWNMAANADRNVIVNNLRLASSTLQRIEHYYGVKVRDGRYWYDAVSGLWGRRGHASARGDGLLAQSGAQPA